MNDKWKDKNIFTKKEILIEKLIFTVDEDYSEFRAYCNTNKILNYSINPMLLPKLTKFDYKKEYNKNMLKLQFLLLLNKDIKNECEEVKIEFILKSNLYEIYKTSDQIEVSDNGRKIHYTIIKFTNKSTFGLILSTCDENILEKVSLKYFFKVKNYLI